MRASAYPVKTHSKKRVCVRDMVSGESNERGNDSGKEGQCELLHNICCASPLQAHRFSVLAHSSGVHYQATGLLVTGYRNICAFVLEEL